MFQLFIGDIGENMIKLHFITFLLFVFILSSFLILVNATTNVDITVSTPDQCSNPTVTFNIQGQAPDIYNVTNFIVSADACVKVNFKNADTIDHTFSIAEDSANNVTYFNLYAGAGDTVSSNFQAPTTNSVIQYFCQVSGHKEAGMYGSLKIEATNSSSTSSISALNSQKSITTNPSFEFDSVFIAFLSIVVIGFTFKKKAK